MAWKNYVPSLATTPPAAAVSLTIPSPKSNTPTLLIDHPTVTALGWTTATALAIAVGDGEDFGKIRIWPHAGAPSTLRKPGGTHYTRLRLLLGRAPFLSATPFRGPCEFTIEVFDDKTKTLVVTLPEPARAKPAPRPQVTSAGNGHQLPARTAAAVRQAMGQGR